MDATAAYQLVPTETDSTALHLLNTIRTKDHRDPILGS